MRVESGADLSLIGEADWRALGSPKLSPSPIILRAANSPGGTRTLSYTWFASLGRESRDNTEGIACANKANGQVTPDFASYWDPDQRDWGGRQGTNIESKTTRWNTTQGGVGVQPMREESRGHG